MLNEQDKKTVDKLIESRAKTLAMLEFNSFFEQLCNLLNHEKLSYYSPIRENFLKIIIEKNLRMNIESNGDISHGGIQIDCFELLSEENKRTYLKNVFNSLIDKQNN